MNNVGCKTCDRGVLQLKKTYRMSGAVVAIGYIFLIPSVLGMLGSVSMMCTARKVGSATNADSRDEAKKTLREAGISELIVEKVVSSQDLSDAETATLTPAENIRVKSVQSVMTAGKIGAGAGMAVVGGLSVLFLIGSFVGGLLGWLLVMKKKVLQCNRCAAVVSAS